MLVHCEKVVHGEKAVRDHHGKIVAHTAARDLTACDEIISLTREGISGGMLFNIRASPISCGSIP